MSKSGVRASSSGRSNLTRVKRGNTIFEYRDTTNPVERFEQNRSLAKHYERLHMIKERPAIDNKEVNTRVKKIYESKNNRIKSSEWSNQHKQRVITNENMVLLKKLVDISVGKRSMLPQAAQGRKLTERAARINIYPGQKIKSLNQKSSVAELT